jgi:hypothetical protein
MFLWTVALGLAIGKLLGGKISNFATLNYKAGWWVALAFGIQLFSIWFLRQPYPTLSGIFLIVGFLLLLYAVWLNRRLAGMSLIFIGIFLNFLVITANGGVMPITTEILEQTNRTSKVMPVTDENSHVEGMLQGSKAAVVQNPNLLFLGDVIVLPMPGGGSGAVSIGDIVLAIGVIWFCLKSMQITFWRSLRYT